MSPPLLRYFDCAHLPQHLQAIVAPFRVIAHKMVEQVDVATDVQGLRDEIRDNHDEDEAAEARRKLHRAEACGVSLEVRLRLLLEAKDCAVRAMIPVPSATT